MSQTELTGAQVRALAKSRTIDRVVVLGANGTMGFGGAALFTTAVGEVTFLNDVNCLGQVPGLL